MTNENIILKYTYSFALEIIQFSHELEKQKKFVLAKQVFRSGTSIGANVREAQGAESKADFRHKMYVAYKEAKETQYWLSLSNDSPEYPSSQHLLEKVEHIIKILGKIISTTKK